jgi:hypothetical protein
MKVSDERRLCRRRKRRHAGLQGMDLHASQVDGGGEALEEDGGLIAGDKAHVFGGHEGDGEGEFGVVEADDLFLEIDDLDVEHALVPFSARVKERGDEVNKVGDGVQGEVVACLGEVLVCVDQFESDLMAEELFWGEVDGEKVEGEDGEAIGIEEGVGRKEVGDLWETLLANAQANALKGLLCAGHASVIGLSLNKPLEPETRPNGLGLKCKSMECKSGQTRFL